MSPGRQKSTHLTLQLRGFPVAAEDGGSLALQHTLQGSTLCPTHSHQQHLLPTCATQGKAFRHPQHRAQAPAAAWSSPPGHPWLQHCSRGCKGAQNRTVPCACTTTAPVPARQLFGNPCMTLTTGLKELPGDSLNSSSQILFFWLFGILHKSFHSCLLLSAFNLLSTGLLQKSLLQQLQITVRETTSETLL